MGKIQMCLSSLVGCMLMSSCFMAVAQLPEEYELANEYYRRGECEKAIQEYQSLLRKQKDHLLLVYTTYSECLRNMQRYKEYEALVNEAIKLAPEQPSFWLDLWALYRKEENTRKADRLFQQFSERFSRDYTQASQVVRRLMEMQEWYYTRQFILQCRKSIYRYVFAIEMADIYAVEKNYEGSLQEYLLLLHNDAGQVDMVKNVLQEQLDNEVLLNLVEKKLIELSQRYPDEHVFSDLLAWLYLQRGDYDTAFVLLKATDKRFQLGGQQLFQTAMTLYYNQAYAAADQYFSYIKKQYSSSYLSYAAARYSISCKEAFLKQQLNPSKDALSKIAHEYEEIIRMGKGRSEIKEAYTSLAFLYANFLEKPDTALRLLDEAIQIYNRESEFVAWVKIQKADILLLLDQPWEAGLLYAQVEKDVKDTPVAYEAKLRRAKLFYYTGNFELAKEYFDILKAATSRQIANDAMQISLLISENEQQDSLHTPLHVYARADLLFFQQQYQKAYQLLDSLKQHAVAHPIVDDVIWLQATILKQSRNYEQAVRYYQKIVEEYAYEIWADDALFELVNIYFYRLQDSEKAYYYAIELLKKHPDSIFVSQTRKILQEIEKRKPN